MTRCPCLQAGKPMKNPWRTLAIMSFAVFSVFKAYGGMPTFSHDNIAPLYGKWQSSGSTHDVAYLITIGPKWITTYHGPCPYRYKYRVSKVTVDSTDHEHQTLNINLKTSESEYVGRSQDNCFGSSPGLPGDSYITIGVFDEPDPPTHQAPAAISWAFCDGDDALFKGPLTGDSPVLMGCTSSFLLSRIHRSNKALP